MKGKVLIMMNFMTWLTNIERMTAETYESLPALYQDKIRLNYQSYCEGYGYAAYISYRRGRKPSFSFRRAAVSRSGPQFCQDSRLHKFLL